MLGRIIIITIMITITIITAPNKSTGTLTFSVYSSVCVGGGGGVEDTYDSDSQLTCTPQLIKTLYHFCLYLQLTDLAWITRQGTLQSPRWWSLLRGIAHSLLFLLHSVTKKKKKQPAKAAPDLTQCCALTPPQFSSSSPGRVPIFTGWSTGVHQYWMLSDVVSYKSSPPPSIPMLHIIHVDLNFSSFHIYVSYVFV